MKTTTGTNHFSSFYKAAAYYAPYGLTSEDVFQKIQNKEIFVGKPEIKEGQKLYLNKEEGRYFIEG